MNNEDQVVNQEDASLESDQFETEQGYEQAESEISVPDGKDYKAIAEQLSRDIKEKNRKIQELKAQAKPAESRVVAPQIEENSDEETVKRFLRTEATTLVNNKLLTDPTFKDRAPIVTSYIEQGYTFDMADKLAKADIMDKILAAGTETESSQIKQQQTISKAIPEETVAKSTGNVLDDIQKGLIDADPNLVAMLNKYRNRG